MINIAAFRMIWERATTVHVNVTLPGNDRAVVRVTEFEFRITGVRMDNGEVQRDIRLEWVTGIFAI